MAGIDFSKLLSLGGRLNPETTQLFMTFVLEALRSSDPDAYVNAGLKRALTLKDGKPPA